MWQEWGETRVLGKRVYFESKILKSLKREKSSKAVAQDCLSLERRKNEGSFMDTVQLRKNFGAGYTEKESSVVHCAEKEGGVVRKQLKREDKRPFEITEVRELK